MTNLRPQHQGASDVPPLLHSPAAPNELRSPDLPRYSGCSAFGSSSSPLIPVQGKMRKAVFPQHSQNSRPCSPTSNMEHSTTVDREMSDSPLEASSPSSLSINSPSLNPRPPQDQDHHSGVTVYGCTLCSLFRSTQDPTHISSEAAKHFEVANSHVFIYYVCPGCKLSACDPSLLAKHFEDGCGEFNELIATGSWRQHRAGDRSSKQIANDCFRWWRTYKPQARLRIIQRGDMKSAKKEKGEHGVVREAIDDAGEGKPAKPKIKLKLKLSAESKE